MRFTPFALLSLGALLSSIQLCPAPFIPALVSAGIITAETATASEGIALATVSGGVAGGVGQIGSKLKLKLRRVTRASNSDSDSDSDRSLVKRIDLPAGVSQESWQQCEDQLAGVSGATIKMAGENGIRVDGVPPACMNLATVVTGNPAQLGGPVPIPMGSAAIEYQDLTQDELNQLKDSLQTE